MKTKYTIPPTVLVLLFLCHDSVQAGDPLWGGIEILPETIQTMDPVQFALEMAARDNQAGLTPEEVVHRMVNRLRSRSDVPFDVPLIEAHRINGNTITPDNFLEFDKQLNGKYDARGERPFVQFDWPEIRGYDPKNPCHKGIMDRAMRTSIEEVAHGFERTSNRQIALNLTPAYKEFLRRTGMRFDSEAWAYAFMEEHLGIKPEVDEILHYETLRAPYFLHRNPDLVPGKGLGEIPSRPAPGPDFTMPSDVGIPLDETDPCLGRLGKLEKAAEAGEAGAKTAGRMEKLGRGLRSTGGKVLRGGGRALGVAGSVGGALGIANLAEATGKGAGLGYAAIKANEQRNHLLWDLYHDPVYAGDPQFDMSRTGSIDTQGMNSKLGTLMQHLSDSLWGNIELGPSLVDVVP